MILVVTSRYFALKFRNKISLRIFAEERRICYLCIFGSEPLLRGRKLQTAKGRKLQATGSQQAKGERAVLQRKKRINT